MESHRERCERLRAAAAWLRAQSTAEIAWGRRLRRAAEALHLELARQRARAVRLGPRPARPQSA